MRLDPPDLLDIAPGQHPRVGHARLSGHHMRVLESVDGPIPQVRCQPAVEPRQAAGRVHAEQRRPRTLAAEADHRVVAHRVVLGQSAGQATHRRIAEQPREFDVEAVAVAQRRRDPGGREGVAAQVEEAVGGTDLFEAEDLGVGIGDRLLDRGGRGDEFDGSHLGSRQRRSVQLADRGQRELVEHRDRGRHHVSGQLRGQQTTKSVHLYTVTDDIGGEARRHRTRGPRRADADDDRGTHLGRRAQHRLDLAEFDAQATELHLVVATTGVLEREVARR